MECWNRCGPAVLRYQNSLVDLLDNGDHKYVDEEEEEIEEGRV